MDHGDVVTIIHYNDVYNVEKGAARFSHVVKSFAHMNPLVLFSGDVFSPSILSTFTKGEHMSAVMNEIGTHCAVFGNHDFDFGLEVLAERVAESKFPWLMSNVIDKETGRPLGEGKISHVVHWAGRKIGLVGLVEKEWLETLATISPEDVTFLDFVEVGEKVGAGLKREGCSLVIALTHMRMPNDKRLAEESTQVDLVLGGHDHVFDVCNVNGKYIVKSGSDFRQMSKISITFEGGVNIEVEEINVTQDIPEDPRMVKDLEKYMSMIESKMGEVLGEFSVELEGRFDQIRRYESNLGNWICDVVLSATGADLVLINSGTMRSDRMHPPGPFTMGDLFSVAPMVDPLVVVEVSGDQVLAALENSVSAYPKLEGRFAQVAGVSFAFDPNRPPGQRVPRELVRVGDEYLGPGPYRLATKTYLWTGCDGYGMLRSAKVLVDEDECPELRLAVQNHFESIRLKKRNSRSRHRQSLITLSRRHSLLRSSCSDISLPLEDLELKTCLLAPTTEDRIIQLTPQLYQQLLSEKEESL